MFLWNTFWMQQATASVKPVARNRADRRKKKKLKV